MARPRPELVLSDDERETLATWAGRPKSTQWLTLRARIVLVCAEGSSNAAVAGQLGVCAATVGTWRSRFVARGLDGLADGPRPGAPRAVSDAAVEQVVTRTPGTRPSNAAHRGTRGTAKAAGLPASSVGRTGRAFGLEPRLADTFTLSTDPFLVEKARDVVGLYMAPPEKAVVLCVGEKPGAQALDRTPPVLPMAPARTGRGTHDDALHGTTSLFAAPGVATGRAIGQRPRRHRRQEFLRFLDHVGANLAKGPGVSVHVVLDRDAAHETPAVKARFPRHPECVRHPTPTSGSWLNQVGRFFAEIAEKRLRRGVFRSAAAREEAIEGYIAGHNAAPRPFAWVADADADAILDRVKRVCERTSGAGG